VHNTAQKGITGNGDPIMHYNQDYEQMHNLRMQNQKLKDKMG